MAQKIVVELVDDPDGTSGDDIETMTFGLDGVSYDIDLNQDNADQLRKALADYIAAGRRVGGRAKRGGAATTAGGNGQAQVIREWAKQHGHEVSERGRIAASVIEAYEAAMSKGRKRK